MREQSKAEATERRNPQMYRWRQLAMVLGPSLLLLPVLGLYLYFKGTPHFFLHTLIGWDVALVLLLLATYFGRSPSR